MKDIVKKALEFATIAHDGQVRKYTGEPYIVHPIEVMEIVNLKKPKIVLFENVRGFLSAKDENGIAMPTRIQHELNKLGYESHYKLLNASDYGVPQNRYRVILLGLRSDI